MVLFHTTAKQRSLVTSLLCVVATSSGSAVAAESPFPRDGLVLAYTFDRTTDDKIPDESGNGNNGEMRNAALETSDPAFKNCCDFDGVRGCVVVPDSTSLGLTKALSISVWVYSRTLKPERGNGIVFKGRSWTGGQLSYMLDLAYPGNNCPRFWVSPDGGNSHLFTVTSPTPIMAGKWYHIVVTYNGKTVDLRVNGVLSATGQYTGGIHRSSDPVDIGSCWQGPWDGYMDSLLIYNRALTEEEIKRLYDAGSVNKKDIGQFKVGETAVTPAQVPPSRPPPSPPPGQTERRPVFVPRRSVHDGGTIAVRCDSTDETPSPSTTTSTGGLHYVEARPHLLRIDQTAIHLDQQVCMKISQDLASYVCRDEVATPIFVSQCTRLLSLSLLLNPTNRTAVVANARLRAKDQLPKVANVPGRDRLAETLRLQSVEIRGSTNAEDVVLAGYFLLAALDIAPDNENATFDWELFKRKEIRSNWDGLTAQDSPPTDQTEPRASGLPDYLTGGVNPAYANRVKKLLKSQTSLKGLFVQSLPNGGYTGRALDIILTGYAHADKNQVRFRFASEVGDQMRTSWEEAVNVLRLRYPKMEGGRDIVASFSDKYSPKDGGSAGMGFALLLISLFDGVDLDPRFAVTGDITIDWKVREVGCIPEKIRGAILDKCAYVAIPKANEQQLEDAILLNSVTQLCEIQVFTVNDLREALLTVSQQKDKNVAEAISVFDKQAQLLLSKTSRGLKDPDILAELKRVSALAPNHASAQYLLKAASNQLRTTLSVAGSVNATLSAIDNLMPRAVYANRRRDMESPFDADVSEEVLKSTRTRLQRVGSIMNPQVRPLHQAMLDYVDAVEVASRAKSGKSSGGLKAMTVESAETKVKNALEALALNEKIVEELIRH